MRRYQFRAFRKPRLVLHQMYGEETGKASKQKYFRVQQKCTQGLYLDKTATFHPKQRRKQSSNIILPSQYVFTLKFIVFILVVCTHLMSQVDYRNSMSQYSQNMSWFLTLSLLQLHCQVFQLTITTSLLWEFQEFSVVFQVVTCILLSFSTAVLSFQFCKSYSSLPAKKTRLIKSTWFRLYSVRIMNDDINENEQHESMIRKSLVVESEP